MPRLLGVSLALVAVSVMTVAVAAATAARQPTLQERAAITAALPTLVQRYPIGCVYLGVVVSSNAHYAKVTPQVFYPLKASCLKYASNGWYILRKTSRWKIIFDGSVSPPCSLGVPKDLLGSLGCSR
jgi:hypothetical protein